MANYYDYEVDEYDVADVADVAEEEDVEEGFEFEAPNFPLPALAEAADALAARYAEVSTRLGEWFDVRWFTVEEADALVAQARVVSAEVEAFIALHDADGKLGLCALMGAGGVSTLVARAERRAVEARKREDARKAGEARNALTAEWRASGGSWKPAGDRITFQGREYILGPVGSRWVARSNMEYMGESVDGDVVSSRSLICPDTGAAALQWNSRWAYPA